MEGGAFPLEPSTRPTLRRQGDRQLHTCLLSLLCRRSGMQRVGAWGVGRAGFGGWGSAITSLHPPLCNSQEWKYHRTGPGPGTCAVFLGRRLVTENPSLSSPSFSYASGPPGPLETVARSGKRETGERGEREKMATERGEKRERE